LLASVMKDVDFPEREEELSDDRIAHRGHHSTLDS
jgi:hypothetical protein